MSNVPETLQQLEIHSTATVILLVENGEILRKIQDFQRFPVEGVRNIHGMREVKHKISFKSWEIVSSRL